MDKLDQFFEHLKIHANELGDKVRDLIHEGNVRRIIIKDEHGHTFMEIPVTVAAIGTVLAPILAAVGAIATLVAHFEVVVERVQPSASRAPQTSSPATYSSLGATEDHVRMADTIPQHVDEHGAKVEDLAGTGEHDSLGG
jgi:hypothetical protein